MKETFWMNFVNLKETNMTFDLYKAVLKMYNYKIKIIF